MITFVQLGCATVFNSHSPRVHVDTDPRGAKVWGNYSSQEETTPALVNIKKGGEVYLDLTKEGYYPHSVKLDKNVQPGFWANFLMGSLFPIGFFIDWQTGNMWNYQDRVFVKLEKKSEGDALLDTGNTERNPMPSDSRRASSKPRREEVNLSGPRLGFTHFTEKLRKQIQKVQRDESGLAGNDLVVRDIVTQFGWHFEKAISMKEAGPMVVVALQPLVGGVDQDLDLVTVNGFLGIRTPSGFEFSVGPTWFEDETAVTYAMGANVSSGWLKVPFNLSVTPLRDGTSVTFLSGFSW